MEKALITASMASMLDNFNRSNIKLLQELGYEVTLAANFDASEDSSPYRRIQEFRKEMEAQGCNVIQIDFTRKAGNIRKQIRSYRQLKELSRKNFQIVHCNSPICAAMTRLAFRKKRRTYGTRVIYTAHGFHFFKGAPLKSWLVYYPVERILSRLTDVLITINDEDYVLAKKRMHAGRVERIPGVGIDTSRFSPYALSTNIRHEKRKELGISDGSFVLLSVGELQARKNHHIVIEALGKLKNPGIVYLIAGQGELENEYQRLISENSLADVVKLLGYRTDITELCGASDCFVHPSIREGLGVAPLEAMACGLPLISAWVNGIRDYTEDGKTGCCVDPKSVDEMEKAINKMYEDVDFRLACGRHNAEAVRPYSLKKSVAVMKEIYEKEKVTYGEK